MNNNNKSNTPSSPACPVSMLVVGVVKLVRHVLPVNPGGHSHDTLPLPSTQVPPFWHVEGVHSCSSQRFPLNPFGQEQLKSAKRSCPNEEIHSIQIHSPFFFRLLPLPHTSSLLPSSPPTIYLAFPWEIRVDTSDIFRPVALLCHWLNAT